MTLLKNSIFENNDIIGKKKKFLCMIDALKIISTINDKEEEHIFII